MDLEFSKNRLHLPQEIVTFICDFLHAAYDLRTARLINKCFNHAATPLITDIWSSPSELFIRPNRTYYKTAVCADDKSDRLPENPFTVWNWFDTPVEIPLNDSSTSIGQQFGDLVLAQANEEVGESWRSRFRR